MILSRASYRQEIVKGAITMKCKDCKYMKTIANTDETGSAICGYPMSFFPIDVNDECHYAPKPLTCKDCDRFGNDWACMTALEDDPVIGENGHPCGGYIDRKETELYNILADWKMRGYNYRGKLFDVSQRFEEEFVVPWEL